MKQVAFGKYTILHRLARGGMAELFLARFSERETVQRAVVIKLVSSTYGEDKSFITMFQDEVRIASKLNHPNIVKVFEVGEVAGSYFLAMEHIFGRDLRTIVSRCLRQGAPVPTPIAVLIGVNICAALQHAHTARAPDGTPLNIVHRDVSLSNIMATYDGQVKLVDFGIAKAANRVSLTLPGTIKGKARYISPEQALGKEVDGRSDIYTLCTTLWEATVGCHLFDQKLDVHVYEAVAKGWVKPPSELVPDYPPELERILLKGLATDLDQRYATALEMQRDLEAYASQAQISLSTLEMSRFMHQLFEEDVSLWQQAQITGKHLLDFLVERAAQEDHRGDLDDVLSSEDERVTAPDKGRGDRAMPNTGPMRRITGPHPPTGPRTGPLPQQPDPSVQPVSLLHQQAQQPPKARKTILYGQSMGEFTPPISSSPDLASPPADLAAPSRSGPAPRHHRVSSETPVAIKPDGSADVLVLEQERRKQSGQRDDVRPTVIPMPDDERYQRDTIIDEIPAAALAKTMTPAPGDLTLDQMLHGAQTEIKAPLGKPEAPQKAPSADKAGGDPQFQGVVPQGQTEDYKTRLPTGDWAHQATSDGGKRAGTHPYFNMIREVARTIVPYADTAEDGEFVAHRKRAMIIALVIGVVIISAIGYGAYAFFRTKSEAGAGPADTAAKARGVAEEPTPAPARAQVHLISKPPNATVYDVASGDALGNTPVDVEVPRGASRKVELRLPGHAAAAVELSEAEPRQEILLVPEEPQQEEPQPEVQDSPRSKRKGGKRPKRKGFKPKHNYDNLMNPFH